MAEKIKGRINKVGESSRYGVLYRGYRPKSFKDLEKLKHFRMQKVTVFNLEKGWFEFFTNTTYEKEDAAKFGVRERNYPMSDVFPPSTVVLTKIVFEILQCLDTGHMVYVHCKWGKDRTGMVIAAYRILHQGWSVEDAIKEMHEYGFHTFPYKFWLRTLHNLKQGKLK